MAGAAEVGEEALGVVDGWLQGSAGGQPLPVQVFPSQGAPVAVGKAMRNKYTFGRNSPEKRKLKQANN